MREQRPGVEFGLGTLGVAVGISVVLWWGVYLIVRWILP